MIVDKLYFFVIKCMQLYGVTQSTLGGAMEYRSLMLN